MTKISVIIPAYNEENVILDLLCKLFLTATRVPDEVIVVNANSTDSTYNKLIEWKKLHSEFDFKIISQNDQTFPGRARNIGVKNAKYEYIAFIDCGVIPSENWLEELSLPLENINNIDICWGRSSSKASTLWENAFALIVESNLSMKRIIPNSCIKKDIFNQIGGFREDLRAGEDVIFKNQIYDLGVNEFFTKATVFYTGYPTNLLNAYNKWKLYSEYSIYAGIGFKKVLLSLIQIALLIASVFLGFISSNYFVSIGIFILLTTIRVLIKSRNSTIKLNSLSQLVLSCVISIFIDFGRVVGLIIGIKNFYKLKTNYKGDVR